MRQQWWILGLVAVMACKGTGDSDSGETDTEETDTEDTDVEIDTDTDVPIETHAALHGRVTDTSGAGVGSVRVNLCKAVCITVDTDANGDYTFPDLDAQTGMFYAVPPVSRTDLLSQMVVLTLVDGDDKTIDVIMQDAATTPIPAVARDLELQDGLHVVAGADNVEPALFTELGDNFLSATVPAEQRMPIELEGEVLAMWHIGPFEATSADGLEIFVDDTFGFVEGDTARVYAASEPTDPRWIDCGTLAPDGEGYLRGDAKLPILTTVVLIKE